MHVEPQPEHLWLQKLIGDWTFESEAVMGPDQPVCKTAGTETVRSLDGIWMICDGSFSMAGGGPNFTIMTLGYDPAKKRFVGTFIGSMMANLWIYDGALAGNVLTLDADGPSFIEPGKTIRYQDIIEFKSAGHRILSSQTLGDDGKWHKFMTAHYRRK